MSKLTPEKRETIVRRRCCCSDKGGRAHHIGDLEIHDKDRDPDNNDPRNLRD